MAARVSRLSLQILPACRLRSEIEVANGNIEIEDGGLAPSLLVRVPPVNACRKTFPSYL